MSLLPMQIDNTPPMMGQPAGDMKETYKGYCVVGMETNLDDEWPEEFCIVPRVGDFVRSVGGTTLKILQVTHLIKEIPTFELLIGKDTTQNEVGF